MYCKPIQIGSLKLESNLIQGPLAGYSTAPFRRLAHLHGRPGYSCTEMISAKDLVYRNPNPVRYLQRDPEEGVLCYQLACNEPEILSRAIDIISPYQPDIIDLNCGCPVKKIRQKGIGSKLLQTPELLQDLVRNMRQSTDAVVTIKIRIGDDQDTPALIDAAESAGVDMITVHGRHWTHKYDVPCNLDAIKAVKQIASVPIFANGDAEDAESTLRLFEQTGCDGVMIARAGVGQPWLYRAIQQQEAGEAPIKPSISQRGEWLLEHIHGLIDMDGEKLAILQSRKLAKYYAREITNAKTFVEGCQRAEHLSEVEQLVREFFVD
jgi:tRNA-dihydrouridine synthase B